MLLGGLPSLLSAQASAAGSIDSKAALAALAARRAELREKLPPPDLAALTPQATNRDLGAAAGMPGYTGAARRDHTCTCPTHEGNPLSSLLVREENPAATRFEGFVVRDDKGRRTRPWRAHTREECRRRGVVVHRPLLVFLETPPQREDFTQPWFGPVRFDRPNFFTTKERLAEQVFGKNFDFRDPNSMAGFYHRESGGRFIIRGDASSVHTVTVPFMQLDLRTMAEQILAQLDPLVDFTQRADEFGWVHPIIVLTPFSTVFDVYDPNVMGGTISATGLTFPLFYDAPLFTADAFPDGAAPALSMIALAHVAINWGWNHVPGDPWFGLPDELFSTDHVYLYAHEYGHAIGLDHQFTLDYGMDFLPPDASNPFGRMDPPYAFRRNNRSGYATSIMNYSPGTGYTFNLIPPSQPQWAGLDPVSRTKLGWGNVAEITLAENRRAGPGELAPGDKRWVNLVEHLGERPHEHRPQILKVNLPPQEVALYPRKNSAGNSTGYWRPGTGKNRRMAWSGTTWGGSRTMETTLRIPAGLSAPVLSFWTKYGSHSGYRRGPGAAFGWVQLSTDGGETWTSLAGQTSSTVVAPRRAELVLYGDDLGAPAFTGDSRSYAADGWIFEQVPLPVAPGTVCRLRFNHSGNTWLNTFAPQDIGWWIDDICLGTADDLTRHRISDFEGRDIERWEGLQTTFDQGFGFVVVEEKAAFPHAYLFELRGNNAHDDVAYQEIFPRPQAGALDLAYYAYQPGVTGYYTNHYASYWAQPFRFAGSATGNAVPVDRLRQFHWDYPLSPYQTQDLWWDFSFALSVALDPANPFGYTLADLAFDSSTPSESFSADGLSLGTGFVVESTFPVPSPVTLLDATPTYRPWEIVPSEPQWLLPELGPFFSPPIGAVGGWPKSLVHGPLGANDPTTTISLGQPYLMRDAAFHPKRNARFDDGFDYHGTFSKEFSAWHEGSTLAALGSPTRSERYAFVPTVQVPVSDTEYIQRYRLFFQPQDAAGNVVPTAQATTRPWIEQLLYERFVNMVYLSILDLSVAPPPAEQTLATKPAWEAFYANLFATADQAHQIANQMLEHARHLGDNPDFAAFNFFGDQGALSPGYWGSFYLDAWTRAKGPAPLPSYGLTVEVEHITKGKTPMALLQLRRVGERK